MAESRITTKPHRLYRVEFDGVDCAEFVAQHARLLVIDAMGTTDAYISELPANYDPAAKDTYSARPPKPAIAMRAERGKWQPWTFTDLLDQPAGTYFVRFDGHGEARVQLDP